MIDNHATTVSVQPAWVGLLSVGFETAVPIMIDYSTEYHDRSRARVPCNLLSSPGNRNCNVRAAFSCHYIQIGDTLAARSPTSKASNATE